MDDYEQRLREALAKAEEQDTGAFEAWMKSEAHTFSNEAQMYKTLSLTAGGRVMGLAEALNLLTGEEQMPNVAAVRWQEAKKEKNPPWKFEFPDGD